MKYIVTLRKLIEKKVVVDADSDEMADQLIGKGKYDFSTERVLTDDIYLGWEYISNQTSQTVITSEEDLKKYYDTHDMDRFVFECTECGCCYRAEKDFVGLNGYAEGSEDAECPEHRLYFPFTIEEWKETLKKADQEGCDLWHEYNEG